MCVCFMWIKNFSLILFVHNSVISVWGFYLWLIIVGVHYSLVSFLNLFEFDKLAGSSFDIVFVVQNGDI